MNNNLKKKLKNDIWNIIQNKDIENGKIEPFLNFVFYLFLEKDKFKVKDLMSIAEKLKKNYNKILQKTDEFYKKEGGDIIKMIEDASKEFNDNILKTIDKVNKCKSH